MKRYTITAIKKDGLRQLAFDNNHTKNYETKELADQALKDVLKNNSEERILELVGSDLKVMPVECYAGGDAKQKWFTAIVPISDIKQIGAIDNNQISVVFKDGSIAFPQYVNFIGDTEIEYNL